MTQPARHYTFRVKWAGKYLAGVTKVCGLERTTEVVTHREGGEPGTTHKVPGRTEFDAITLEIGITHELWASEFRALPELDADAGTIVIQQVKLENGGGERHDPVAPLEPTFTERA